MDDPTEGAGALAVDDADLEHAPFPAGLEIITHQVFYLAGMEGMEVENAVKGKFKRTEIVHG
jgi:hypothetical protein